MEKVTAYYECLHCYNTFSYVFSSEPWNYKLACTNCGRELEPYNMEIQAEEEDEEEDVEQEEYTLDDLIAETEALEGEDDSDDGPDDE